MKLVVAASFALFALTAAGCAAQPVPAEETTTSDLVPASASCKNELRRTYLTSAQTDAQKARFTERNAGAWKFSDVDGIDDISGTLGFVSRSDVSGASSVTPAGLASAYAFVAKNADLFDLTPWELGFLAYRVSAGDGPNAIVITQHHVVDGTWAYQPPLERSTYITLFIASDDSVATVRVWGGANPPVNPGFCETPSTDPLSAPILAHVIGTEVFYNEPSFQPVPAVSIGHVERANVKKWAPAIYRGLSDTEESLTIIWSISVERQGHGWDFDVNAQTGEVLEVRAKF